ncbi:hypothetical protein [Pediococcus argentinicus]|uniref:hypothetical protein n=1 Tax=Pediococcus argentinicus TaxID=480391 RepID=UPI00070F926B|nr:hypothetical protein [Pediococcus argentinicus]NKZ22492.1 hypothetical protein [Pediococcus argentinicus]GEP20180.1 hypothetical protein LSA03_15640 [Pediococcus argentinicus]
MYMNSKTDNYVFNITSGQINTAGSKAKIDITNILKKENFESIDFKVPSNKIIKVLMIPFFWRIKLKNINKGCIVVQYPMYSNLFLSL